MDHPFHCILPRGIGFCLVHMSTHFMCLPAEFPHYLLLCTIHNIVWRTLWCVKRLNRASCPPPPLCFHGVCHVPGAAMHVDLCILVTVMRFRPSLKGISEQGNWEHWCGTTAQAQDYVLYTPHCVVFVMVCLAVSRPIPHHLVRSCTEILGCLLFVTARLAKVLFSCIGSSEVGMSIEISDVSITKMNFLVCPSQLAWCLGQGHCCPSQPLPVIGKCLNGVPGGDLIGEFNVGE